MDTGKAEWRCRLLGACLLLVVLAIASVSSGQSGPTAGYWDTFDYPDGTLPEWWHWTGYSDGGGSFLVQGSAFTHVEGGAAYYYRDSWCGARNLPGWYDFQVKDANWVFAWRISSDDPTAGRCLWLSHDDLSGSYTFAECSWENLDPQEYPDGEFMWNNATVLRSVQCEAACPPVGWHTVSISEGGPQALELEIFIDHVQIFDVSYEFIPEGLQGIGCLVGGEMTPAFDSIWAQWPDPVEAGTWGCIKALYR